MYRSPGATNLATAARPRKPAETVHEPLSETRWRSPQNALSYIMRLALTLVIASSFLGLATGCTAAAEEGASSEAALSDASRGITVTEQRPLDVQLGQAVAADQAGAGWGDGTLLAARCVGGDVHSTLDTMKETGATSLGLTALAQAGVAPDGSPGLLTSPAVTSARFYLSAHPGNKLTEPTMRLDDVAAFEASVSSTPTRMAGFAEVLLEHNAFSLENEHRTSTGRDCAARYVRGVTSKRFILYGFRIDFVEEQDIRGFNARFNGGINNIFSTHPDVQAFLLERGAKVSAHVLVSTGLGGWVEQGLAGQSCDVSNLAACKALNAKLATMSARLASVPGDDDTLEAMRAPGSTWGAYQLMIPSYDQVFP